VARMVTLGKIATVQQGMSRSGRSAGAREGSWQIRLATASDIQNDRLVLDELETIAIEHNPRTERYLLQSGDVLVTARSTKAKMALVPPSATRVVADAGLLLVRGSFPFVPIGPYLWWYLTSLHGRAQVEQRMVGVAILSLSPRSLMEIELPLPTDTELDAIAELVDASERAFTAGVAAAELRRTLYRDQIIAQLRRAAPEGLATSLEVRQILKSDPETD
jgi:hypothetical protein